MFSWAFLKGRYHGLVKLISINLILGITFSNTVMAEQNEAHSLLKSMSDYLSSQKNIELTFDSDIEIITPQLEKIQFTNSGKAVLSRPNKLYAHRLGGFSEVELFFNGKSASVYGKSSNAFAQFEGVSTVDELLEALRQGHGVALPGADLLQTKSYDILMADVLEAKYLGIGIIDGRECEHLAFRNHDTDWQIWIEAGKHPVPRKMVITSKTINSAPQYTLRIKQWKTDVKPSPDQFTFTPPEGVKQLSPDALIDLDELPQDVPPGGNP